jgi:hypothetical protein
MTTAAWYRDGHVWLAGDVFSAPAKITVDDAAALIVNIRSALQDAARSNRADGREALGSMYRASIAEASEQLLLMRIDDLVVDDQPCPVRLANCSQNRGALYIGLLVMMSAREIMRTKNLGRTTCRQLERGLAELGLHLAPPDFHKARPDAWGGFWQEINPELLDRLAAMRPEVADTLRESMRR